jgi:hypothetical protein
MLIEKSKLIKLIKEEIEIEKDKIAVKNKIKNVFDSKKMFKTLFNTGRLEVPFSTTKVLSLTGNLSSGDLSFKLKGKRDKGDVFLKGEASDLFSKDKLAVMFKVGVKI